VGKPIKIVHLLTILMCLFGLFGEAWTLYLVHRLGESGYEVPEVRDLISGTRKPLQVVSQVGEKCLEDLPANRLKRGEKGGLLAAARPYLPIVRDAAMRYRVKEELILAIIKAESQFDHRAVSPKGAMGLMQLMPDTAIELGVSNPFDPYENILAGTKYLAHCIRRFNNVPLALAAYNAGPVRVAQMKKIPPFRETEEYVSAVLHYERAYDRLIRAFRSPSG